MSGITRLDAAGLRRGFRERELSALDATRAFLARIDDLDPRLRAMLHRNERAEDEAREADRRLASGDSDRLCGIPVVLKDNLITEDMPTTCASRLLDGFSSPRDATVVARLRSRGAVVLGKTNMDEFGMGSSTENSAFGPTRNPWDPERVPGGSSGGSAAAVAARLAPLSLGSDTGGSLRQPAAFCGIVGLKPTYGRVSRSGLVAFGSSLDQVGPLAGSVRDCAVLLSAIAGPDPADATAALERVDDYESACDGDARGLVVGLPQEYFAGGLDPEIEDRVRQAARVLEDGGARVEPVSLPHTRYAIPAYYLVATAEASSNLSRFDGLRYGRRAKASDLQETYRASRSEGFGAEVRRRILLGTFALSAGHRDAFYEKAQRTRTLLRLDFARLRRSAIDLLLTPTTPTPAFRLGEKVDDPLAMYLSDVYTVTANLAGLPAVSVPVGLTAAGLPIGAQLIGSPFGESCLLRCAATIEAAFGKQSAPVGGGGATSSRPESPR